MKHDTSGGTFDDHLAPLAIDGAFDNENAWIALTGGGEAATFRTGKHKRISKRAKTRTTKPTKAKLPVRLIRMVSL
jgi:hypothetical protein